jgi:hypothetical protein
MLFGRPLMIHDRDAYLVAPPTAQDDRYIMPGAILTHSGPSKMAFYIATCQLYRILGHILRELYSPKDDYRTLKDWIVSVPSFLHWGSEEEVCDDIIRQRNILRAR